MARIVIDCKEKTKKNIVTDAKKEKRTIKSYILKALGLDDE